MMDLTDKQQLIKYLQSHGLYTRKKLGQNFLVDREVLNKIIEAADLTTPAPLLEKEGKSEGDIVIEVGPGLGVLTTELVQRAKKVIAVELDDKLAELLAGSFNAAVHSGGISRLEEPMARNDILEVINADILHVNINKLIGGLDHYKVVANIPYYITSKIIKLFLTTEKKPESIIIMVQKEVAERICAKPGEMSVLALSVQLYGDPSVVGIVKKESFFPAPEVDSAILKIENIGYKKPEVEEKELFRTIKIGFASKRKTLLNNFSAGYHLNKEKVNDIISSVGIEPAVRAEALDIDDWVKLTKVFNKI